MQKTSLNYTGGCITLTRRGPVLKRAGRGGRVGATSSNEAHSSPNSVLKVGITGEKFHVGQRGREKLRGKTPSIGVAQKGGNADGFRVL